MNARWFGGGMVLPQVVLLGRPRSLFRLAGYVGLAASIALALQLVAFRGAPTWPMLVVAVVAIVTFLALAMATKVITGTESLTLYHHLIAVLALSALTLWLLGQPILVYLDATVLGVGLFIAFGRVGCLSAGCCHGRPWARGVRYRDEHAAAGFPRHMVGVPLFPIQAIEAASLVVIVTVGAVLVARGAAPGAALLWYLSAYAIERFLLEFARGDPPRPYLWGFSEAQWTSLALSWGVAGAGLTGILPGQFWPLVGALGTTITTGVVAMWRRSAHGAWSKLLTARHIDEVARALTELKEAGAGPMRTARPADIELVRTSLGILISSDIGSPGGTPYYALSRLRPPLSPAEARALAHLVMRLRHSGAPLDLGEGGAGVWHLNFGSAATAVHRNQAGGNVHLPPPRMISGRKETEFGTDPLTDQPMGGYDSEGRRRRIRHQGRGSGRPIG
ncbi:MAG: prolipoprotein diacylglyceryl transferase [Actinomycetota bacterium]|nr:prolipoprotein diacylglyceryl transferase [Actinomycetota bacterium]